MHGVVRPLSIVGLRVDGFVGSNVRVAEKIAGGHDDVAERGDPVDGSQAILRPLGVVSRFGTVSDEKRGEGREETLTEMPFSVSVLRIHPGGVGLLHERIPVLRRAAEKRRR